MNQEAINKRFSEAIKAKDTSKVEDVLSNVWEFGLREEFVPHLISLLQADWHYRHEDIALALQGLKDNRATEALNKTAHKKFEYLAYDDSYALSRKCTWALADIGTQESKSALEEIARSDDKTIAGYASRRLERWELESERKLSSLK